MSDADWQVFARRGADGPRVIYVDCGPPDPGRPWRVDVAIALRNPAENGLPRLEEDKTIERLVDVLRDRLGQNQFVAKVCGGGNNEIVFHVDRRDVVAVVRGAAAATLPGHEVTCDVVEDAAWQRRRELLPTPLERKLIGNRQVLDVLRTNGDPLTERRPIVHWAYFGDEASRERAAIDLASQGFRMEARDRVEERHGDRPYSLRFARDEIPDAASADAFVELAHGLCASAGGEYDGWETAVLRGAPPPPSSKRSFFGRLLGG